MKVRIKALSDNQRRFAVVFMGHNVAVAFGRDSGAKVGYNVHMINGKINSGGSRVNWYCEVKQGSVFELEVDDVVFEANKNRITKWSIEVIEEFSISLESSKAMANAINNLE